MERVVGGEADAGEHLLAVRGDDAGGAAGLCASRARRSSGRARPTPRRVSPRGPRSRPASRRVGVAPPGTSRPAARTARARPRACRARSSIVRHAPAIWCATARRPASTAASHASRAERSGRPHTVAVLDAHGVQPAVGIGTARGRRVDRAGRHRHGRGPTVDDRDHKCLARGRDAMAREASRARSVPASIAPGALHDPIRREHDRETGLRCDTERGGRRRRRAQRTTAFDVPSAVKTIAIASRGSASSISSQPRSVSTLSTAAASAPDTTASVIASRTVSSRSCAFGRVHQSSPRLAPHSSVPRSSRRRAMMLRCTSAVPP